MAREDKIDLRQWEDFGLDKTILVEIVTTRMPFGRFQGVLICDLPEAFLIWFKNKGWPKGRLGVLLENTLEIKSNGANLILQNLKNSLRK